MKKQLILCLVITVLSGWEFVIAGEKEELILKQQPENMEREAQFPQSRLQVLQDGSKAPEIVPTQPIVVKGFRFEGNESIPSADLQTILAKYIDQPCDLEKLQEAADLLTQEYARRGLNFAKAYLPAQDITGGIVKIVLVEGRLGEIQVEGNRNYSSEFIRRFLKRAADGSVLTSKNLERGLLILNSEFTDLNVSAELKQGKEPGTVGVRALVKDSFPVHLRLFANNYGSEFVSRYRFGAQAEWTNAIIPGALLSAGGVFGEKPDHLAYGTGGYLVPVNAIGTKVGVNFSYGKSEVGKEFAELGIWNKMLTSGVFVTHPLIKSRTGSLSGELGFRYSDVKYYLLEDYLSSRDKIRLVYAEMRGDHVAWRGKSFASFNITQGLGSLLGGTKSDDPYASRIGADNKFTRLTLMFARQQPLNDTFALLGSLSGQWSSDSLLASEEWQVGGIDSVRGYAPGEAAGDHGYKGSLEFSAAPLKTKEILRLSTFIDHGVAYRKRTLLGQSDSASLTGAGFGVSSHIDFYVPIDIRMDIGWPISPRNNSLNEDPVLYFSVIVRF